MDPKKMSSQNKDTMRGQLTSGFQDIRSDKHRQNSTRQAMTDNHPTAKYNRNGWVLKAKESTSTIEQKKESPQHSNELTKVIKKATVQKKGKWVPKVAAMPIISYEEMLPSTSSLSYTNSTTNTTEIQS